MADPLVNILSLSQLTNSYSVFEADQVLTYDQLNSVADYLNDQGRLTRVALLGVGVVAGLRATASITSASTTVSVSRGLGITTDGDLLLLATDTVFQGFREYGTSAPKYDPLYSGDTMRTVFEIVPDPADDATAKPLSAFPSSLTDMVVVLLMESYAKDRNVCTGTQCDNLGKTAIDTPRVLLVSRADATALSALLGTVGAAALKLDEIAADRPALGASITTVGPFAATYRAACKRIIASLTAAFPTLQANLPTLVTEVFGSDPAAAWTTAINKHFSDFAARDVGIQYLYDFLKDIAETWNAVRETLADDDGILLPDATAFPKHLLLGDLGDPTAFRTAFYPSPLVDGNRAARGHARSLLRKLGAMIATFSLPTSTTSIEVTPSLTEAASLEERAIPYYYAVQAAQPIQRDWNDRLARRGASTSNLGYRAKDYGGTSVAQNPLAFQLARYDFFRVEGHLGQDVRAAMKELTALVAARNLPFTVRAVLLHNDRKAILFPPLGWRYGDLHRIHYLIRNEMAARLGETAQFNKDFKSNVDTALARNDVPDPERKLATTATTRNAELNTSLPIVQTAMTTKAYTDYLANPQWRGAYKTVVNSAASFKSELGDVLRTDVSSPFDGLAISNHAAWLDWLDTLIQAKNDRENDKLLFSSFITAHPEFEHLGGVPRGGTFVLLYDDNSRVVGDGALPYVWHETAEAPPVEPDLPAPSYKIPLVISGGVKVKPLLDTVALQTIKTTLGPVIDSKVDLQKNYIQFFKDSVTALSPIVNRTPTRTGLTVTDPVLQTTLDQIQWKADGVDSLRQLLTRPDLTIDQRNQVNTQLKSAQAELSTSMVNAAQYVSASKADVSARGDGTAALGFLAGVGSKVSDTTARSQLVTGLQVATRAAPPTHTAALGNLVTLMGM